MASTPCTLAKLTAWRGFIFPFFFPFLADSEFVANFVAGGLNSARL
jgi:hypothetical protein